jgi:hypothetical protein
MNVLDILKYGHRTLLTSVEDLPEPDWEIGGVCGVWSVKAMHTLCLSPGLAQNRITHQNYSEPQTLTNLILRFLCLYAIMCSRIGEFDVASIQAAESNYERQFTPYFYPYFFYFYSYFFFISLSLQNT